MWGDAASDWVLKNYDVLPPPREHGKEKRLEAHARQDEQSVT